MNMKREIPDTINTYIKNVAPSNPSSNSTILTVSLNTAVRYTLPSYNNTKKSNSQMKNVDYTSTKTY